MKPRQAVIGLSLALLTCAACGSSAPMVRAPHVVGRNSGHRGGSTSDVGRIVGKYTVDYDGTSELHVTARFEKLEGDGSFTIESGAESFLKEFQVAPLPANPSDEPKWQPGKEVVKDRTFIASPCALGPCALRYRFSLRAAAKHIEDLDTASEEGQLIEAPPSTWLLTPANTEANERIRFSVKTAAGTSFATGVYHAPDDSNAFEIAVGDLWTGPYSAFGPMRTKILEPTKDSRIELAIGPGALGLSDDQLTSFTNDAARAIVTYFGRFPIPEALVLFMPGRGRWIGEGKTLAGGGGSIFMRIGETATTNALAEDWVLVHEMTHLTFPSVPRESDWAEEGLATYVEPFARARVGLLSPENVWDSLVEGLPNGLPKQGDRGLDQTPTWGRRYWGGALFYLLADVEIRKRTANRFGLEHALRGILEAGGNNTHRWALDDAYDAGDKATGVPVLRELHTAMGTSPHPVDLDALWRELGVVRSHGSIRFDDKAPLAAIRRIMTAMPGATTTVN